MLLIILTLILVTPILLLKIIPCIIDNNNNYIIVNDNYIDPNIIYTNISGINISTNDNATSISIDITATQ